MEKLLQNPLLGALGALLVLSALLAPLILRLAGLSGAQIVELLRATLAFILEAIRELRAQR